MTNGSNGFGRLAGLLKFCSADFAHVVPLIAGVRDARYGKCLSDD